MAAPQEQHRLKIANIRIPVAESQRHREITAARLGILPDDILHISILRRSIDARQRPVVYVYSLVADCRLRNSELQQLLARDDVSSYDVRRLTPPQPLAVLRKPPVVVGCGPAGLFAALMLCERGAPPPVLERGERIPGRVASVRALWESGVLNPESNVLFGEGGAGTFSDGKLTARSKSPLKQRVLEELVAAGADESILYDARPHVGTDRLRAVIPAMVDCLRARGAAFCFGTRVDEILIDRGRVTGVRCGAETLETGALFLAIGHSARDTYRMLAANGVQLQPKGFAVGVRVEHPQQLIDEAQWGDPSVGSQIGPADYALTYKDAQTGRGVYTFCMSGGIVSSAVDGLRAAMQFSA